MYLKTGFVGSESGRFLGTLSVIIATQFEGKNPTKKPCLPLHQTLSSGDGMSITEIMSPT